MKSGPAAQQMHIPVSAVLGWALDSHSGAPRPLLLSHLPGLLTPAEQCRRPPSDRPTCSSVPPTSTIRVFPLFRGWNSFGELCQLLSSQIPLREREHDEKLWPWIIWRGSQTSFKTPRKQPLANGRGNECSKVCITLGQGCEFVVNRNCTNCLLTQTIPTLWILWDPLTDE